jgi:holo-[acyl-carrier protein] synthase
MRYYDQVGHVIMAIEQRDSLMLRPDASGWHLAMGIDLIEVERIAATVERFGDRFLQRIFAAEEIAITGRNAVRLAGRFAAKEACAKALGTGIGDVHWTEVVILRDDDGKPVLRLDGYAAELARRLGWIAAEVSITTTHHYSMAAVIAWGVPPSSSLAVAEDQR